MSLKGIGQAQAELQTVWVKIAPNTSWCAALLRTVHQRAESDCKLSSLIVHLGWVSQVLLY